MTNKKISDLTATTTVGASDLFAIVQSGETKKITGANLTTAVAPSAASTTTAGIIEIATNAETATGTDTSRAITPDDLRYGAANGAFQKVVLSGATGSVSNGDMNISGNYYINGAAISSVVTATPVAFTSTGTVTITVDFTTYVAYDLYFQLEATLNENVDLAGSSNAGGAYTSATVRKSTDGTFSAISSGVVSPATMTNGDWLQFSLVQPLTSGSVKFEMNGSQGSSTTAIFRAIGFIVLSAACDRIRFRFNAGGSTCSGRYVLIPRAKR